MERTLIILKPDALDRGLVGRILTRFEDKALQLLALKLDRIPPEQARRHYAVHAEKPFFPQLVEYVTSGPVLLAVLAGPGAIGVVRKLLGATFGSEAEAGTIRGDFALSRTCNLVHASDSPESAAREIELFFRPGELHSWSPAYRRAAFLPGEEGYPEGE